MKLWIGTRVLRDGGCNPRFPWWRAESREVEKEEEETVEEEMEVAEREVVETEADWEDWEGPWRKRKFGPGCLHTTR